MQRIRKSPLQIHPDLNWRMFIVNLVQVNLGIFLAVLSLLVFFAPANIAPAGIAGISVILNDLFSTPIGLVVLIGNLPILYLSYRMLSLKSVIWMIYVTVVYSVMVDVLAPFFPSEGVTDDLLLNALFAGILGGIGGGLVIRSEANFGGTSAIARILQLKFGMPLSSTYMYANLLVILLAGVFLGWESALLSFIALMIEGMASDYILEGPSVIRTATIITDHPREVADVVLNDLQRGVTGWEGQGMYSNTTRHILFVTISRSRVNELKDAVLQTDPTAFVVIGHGHTAYGRGFKRAPHMKVQQAALEAREANTQMDSATTPVQ